jgi:hypothetical protein
MMKRIVAHATAMALALLIAIGAPLDVWVHLGPVSAARTATALSVFSASVLLMAWALWFRRREMALPGSRSAR